MTTPQPGIVVGVDFSDASRRALDHAIPLSLKLGAELVLLHAWNPTGWGTGPETVKVAEAWLDGARQSAQAKLEQWAEAAREAGVRATTRLEAAAASRLLRDAVRRHRAELLIVGRKGHAGLEHVLLGSVSERVVRLASCPVLVVPDEAATAGVPQRLLVGVDFSRAARDALDVAVRLARDLEVPRGLVLVHAYPGERQLWLESWSELAHRAKWPYDQEALESWAAPRLAPGVEMDARVVDAPPETALVEIARSAHCDWIVVGVEGRTALADLLIGRTTDRVLKLADRPILAVPSVATPPGEAAGGFA